jgi:hypothetical protein
MTLKAYLKPTAVMCEEGTHRFDVGLKNVRQIRKWLDSITEVHFIIRVFITALYFVMSFRNEFGILPYFLRHRNLSSA